MVVELRGRSAMEFYTGLARVRPVLAASLTIALLSFIGIPPLAGCDAKLALFAATIDAGYAWLAALAVVNTVVSIFYERVIGPAYFGLGERPLPVLGSWAAVSTQACAVAVVVAGIAVEPLLRVFEAARLLL